MCSICESCTSKCIVYDIDNKVEHCDCYNGILQDVSYNGDIDLYEKEQKLHYMTVDEIMKDAKPCTLFKDVQEEIIKEANSPEAQVKENKRLAGIASIMNKIVGTKGDD
jgi:hypothetical protein